MARSLTGPRVEDHRYREVMAERTDHAHELSRGVSAWSAGALERRPLRLPELALGFLLALEAYSVSLGPFAVPVNEVAGLALVGLAVLRRSRRDTSRLEVTALLAGMVILYLAGLSMAHGIPDADWLRRLVRMTALTVLVGFFAGRRLSLRSVLVGLLTAMAVNVPLFYLGLVPAPYQGFLTGFLADKNVAGLYYAAIPVLALPYIRTPQRRLLVLLAAAVCLFLTGSRTSMAAFACAVVWVWLTPRLGPVLRIGLLLALGWAVAYAEDNLARIGIFSDRDGTDWFRGRIHDATALKVEGTPWTGRGLTEAHVHLEDGSSWLFHNSYAGLYVEGGAILFGAMLLAYAVYGLRLTSGRLRTPPRVAVEAAAVVVLVTATQLGEVFVTIPSMLILAAGVGLALTEAETAAEEQITDRRREQILEQARARFA